MKYFYLNNEHLIKGYPAVLLMTDNPLDNYEVEFLNKGIFAREYKGEYLPERLVFDDESKKVRIATEQECYDLDPINYVLKEDIHYLKNGIVKEKTDYPREMIKPIFSIEKEIWEESASEVEIKNYSNEIYKSFYYSELESFNKAIAEYNSGVISQTEYEECQAYIRALAAQLNSDNKIEIERPSVMDY